MLQDLVVPGATLGGVGLLLLASLAVFRLMLTSYSEERRTARDQWAKDRQHLEARLSEQDKLHREEQGRQSDRILRNEKHNERCERRLNIMLVAAQQYGMPIPPEIWNPDA